MKKLDMLPVIAAMIIALLVVPTGAFAALPPPNTNLASVKTIPEDDLKRDTGVMVLGLDPADYENTLVYDANHQWYTVSTCAAGTEIPTTGVVVGPEVSDEPILVVDSLALLVFYQKEGPGGICVKHTFAPLWPKDYQPGWDLLSQHKILATLNGVPTKPDYLLCEIVEKEKAKIPPQSDKPLSKRQFPDEVLKTTLIDVTDNFICKVNWIKPGVGALDVYFVGPHVYNFIADHMLIVTAGYKVGTKTVWASELQDICILGWSMGTQVLGIGLYLPYYLSTGYYVDTYWSWDDAIGTFVSCDEAASWQLAWIFGGWGWGEN